MRNFSEQLFSNFKENPGKEIVHIQKMGEPDKHLTYRELFQGSASFSMDLRDKGINPGDVAIIILRHGTELVTSYIGCVLAGVIPSIMPFLTEKLRPEKYRDDMRALIEITKPTVIITYEQFYAELSYLSELDSSIRSIMIIESIGEDFVQTDKIQSLPGLNRSPNEIALLQHSSGTTGLQKGVALSHKAVFNQIDSYRKAIALSKNDVIVSWLPLYHDMGLIASFLMPLLTDTELVLMSPFDWVRAPQRLMIAIDQYKGTLTWLPNFAYNFCAQKIRDEDINGLDLSPLRAVINCSEPMRADSHELFVNRFEQFGFNRSALATSYAMAENVFAVTQSNLNQPVRMDHIRLADLQDQMKAIPARQDEPGTIMVSAGKTIEGTEILILNKDKEPLPDREIGEIMVRGNCLFSGYYNRPEITEKSMVDGWFATGDLGYVADGELFITGRIKDLIIVGGKNIYPQDIEAIVSGIEGVHPGRVVSFGLFNRNKGTEDVAVIAELETGFENQRKDIKREIRQSVSQSTAVVLNIIELVEDKWLIKTSSGKIARSANKAKYMAEFVEK